MWRDVLSKSNASLKYLTRKPFSRRPTAAGGYTRVCVCVCVCVCVTMGTGERPPCDRQALGPVHTIHICLIFSCFYRPQRSCGKVLLSEACQEFCPLGEGASPQGGYIPAYTGPDPPPYTGRPLQRTVRILLECILVLGFFLSLEQEIRD